MIKRSYHLFFFMAVFTACTSAARKPLNIDFSSDSSTIVIQDIDQAGLLQLNNANLSDTVMGNLIAVLQTPSDLDPSILEMPVAGRIHITDSSIVFCPHIPFVKGRDYLVVTHLNANFGDAAKIIKGQLHTHVSPLQKVLSR